MNVIPAWQGGYSGKGVVVSILDDGIQPNHPDLVDNYVSPGRSAPGPVAVCLCPCRSRIVEGFLKSGAGPVR